LACSFDAWVGCYFFGDVVVWVFGMAIAVRWLCCSLRGLGVVGTMMEGGRDDGKRTTEWNGIIRRSRIIIPDD